MYTYYYRAYSNYKEPRSIVNRGYIHANTKNEAIQVGMKLYGDYGRHCTAVKQTQYLR